MARAKKRPIGTTPKRDRRESVAVLLSGGLDSAALLAHYLLRGKNVHPVYVKTGARWDRDQLRATRRLLDHMATPTLQRITIMHISPPLARATHWSRRGVVPKTHATDDTVFLPAKNLILLACATSLCAERDIGTIAIGILKSNPFPDASASFLGALARLAGTSIRRPLQIAAPFRRLTKTAVIRRHSHLPFHLTLSCLAPRGGRHCGACNKCAERRRAFAAAGVTDGARDRKK